MACPEQTRSSINRNNIDEDVDFNIDIVGADDDWGSDFWKMHLSSKYGKPGIAGKEQVDGLFGSDSYSSVSDRYESGKRVSSSNRASIDQDDDYDARKELRSKQFKKNTAGNILDELRACYQDVEAEYNIEGRGKSRSTGYVRAEESESENPDPKNETNLDRVLDGDSRYSERWGNHRDKVCGYGGRERSRRWDERSDTSKSVKHAEESDTRSGCVPSDPRLETSLEKERSDNMENESRNSMGTKFHDKDEIQVGSERSEREDNCERRQEKETSKSRTAYGRIGRRKDGSRTETVRTLAKFGISNKNTDVIEFQTKPFDLGKEDTRSSLSGDGSVTQQSESKPSSDVKEFVHSKKERSQNAHGSMQSGEGSKYGVVRHDQHSLRDADDDVADRSRGPKGAVTNRGSGGSLTPHGNQELNNRSTFQGPVKGNRANRVGRVRPSKHQSGIPVPLLGSPFRPLGLPPPEPMQSLPPNMSPVPGQPVSPAIFIPPFQPPSLSPGTQATDVNSLGVPPGLPLIPVPPGSLGPRIPPNLGNPSTVVSVFSPPGPGRGILPGVMDSNFNASVLVRSHSQDKVPGGWVPPPRTNAPPGKAPSRGEPNDYSQNFVDTGMRPQNFIRELELTNVVEDYPRFRELIQKKDEIVAKSSSPPMYYKCDLKEQALSPDFFGTKFDVILVNPPWEEYVHRAPGVTDHMEYWTFEEIMNLKIEAIADTPSFIFLCVGDGIGLEQGRQCLRKWGFRRCEDICWVKTNKTNATPGLRHDSHTLFQRSKEHYLMGIKGAVRRSTDGHVIHANIDTDVIIAEEPPYGSTAKPEDMYRIIEHFALGRRRLELFGEDHNIRKGWLTVGKGLSSSNFSQEAYVKNFADKDGKVWVGGRNPPPEAPHLVLTTPDIESLRPKSPMKNQQQLQQQLSQSA